MVIFFDNFTLCKSRYMIFRLLRINISFVLKKLVLAIMVMFFFLLLHYKIQA